MPPGRGSWWEGLGGRSITARGSSAATCAGSHRPCREEFGGALWLAAASPSGTMGAKANRGVHSGGAQQLFK